MRIVYLLINKTKVQLSLDDATQTLTVNSLDIETNYQLKLAIGSRFTSDKDVQIDESLILEAQVSMAKYLYFLKLNIVYVRELMHNVISRFKSYVKT